MATYNDAPKEGENHSNLDSHETSDVVILIHGTWGRGFPGFPDFLDDVADWCGDKSRMREGLRKKLGDDTIFEPFNWSGRNSTDDRFLAASQLKVALNKIKSQHPKARIHLVTHSHGGNVAMYCLRDQLEDNNIASLICLSTPFIHARLRHFGSELAEKIQMAIAVFVSILLLVLVVYSVPKLALFEDTDTSVYKKIEEAGKFTKEKNEEIDKLDTKLAQSEKTSKTYTDTTEKLSQLKVERTEKKEELSAWNEARSKERKSDFWVAIIVAIILGWSAVRVSWPRINEGLKKIHKEAHDYGNRLALPLSLPFPVLIIRSSADEASSVLGVFQFFSSLSSALLVKSLAVVPTFREKILSLKGSRLKKTFEYVFKFFIGVVILGVFVGFDYPIMFIISAAPLAILLLLLLLVFLGFLLTWVCVILMACAMIPIMGKEFVYAAVSLQVSAEASPPGTWEVIQHEQNEYELDEHTNPQHSTHSNKKVIEMIADWLSTLPSAK